MPHSPQSLFGIKLRAKGREAHFTPGDPSTAVCMACDTKLRLEGIPEKIQRAYFVTRNEDVTFTRLEDGPHHDGVRFGNGAEVTLQQLGTGVQSCVYDALSSPLAVRETAKAL
jgi:hypothetical protein